MKYLAFDCSSEDIYVCVFDECKHFNICKKNMSGTENLMPAIKECLMLADLKIEDIEVLAVSVGPGSWTGARVAVVSALGIISGLKKQPKIISFNAFDMLSYNEVDENVEVLVKAYANFVYKKSHGEFSCVLKDDVDGTKSIAKEKLVEGVRLVEPNIQAVVDKKIENKEFCDISELEPMYLRLSQAEIQLNRKKENGN